MLASDAQEVVCRGYSGIVLADDNQVKLGKPRVGGDFSTEQK